MNAADRVRFDAMADCIEKLEGSNHEIREKLYNGMSDAVAQIPVMQADIATLNGTVQYIRGKIDAMPDRAIVAEKPPAKTITLRRIAEVAVVAVVVGGCIVGAALIFAGKLTPDDIVRILEAWKGSP